MNKRTIVKHLWLLYDNNIDDVIGNPIVFLNSKNCGSFKYWLKDACNNPYWERLGKIH